MQIYKQLASRDTVLPWDDEHLSAADQKKLGRFRKPIMQLLQRDPSKRANAVQFCKQMFEIFSSTPGGTAVQKDTVATRW